MKSAIQFAMALLATVLFFTSPSNDTERNSETLEPVELLAIDQEPLQVGPPPDSVVLTTLASGGELFTQPQLVAVVDEKFTHPAPPKPAPAKVAQQPAAPAGRWVTQYGGFRGRRSYQIWVPSAGAAGCANGSCAAPAGYFRGGCSSCR